jgi:integrase
VTGTLLVQAKFGLHAMRHACAALLIDQGWQAKRVQEFLGHATIDMTLDLYAYLIKDRESDQARIAALETKLLTNEHQ